MPRSSDKSLIDMLSMYLKIIIFLLPLLNLAIALSIRTFILISETFRSVKLIISLDKLSIFSPIDTLKFSVFVAISLSIDTVIGSKYLYKLSRALPKILMFIIPPPLFEKTKICFSHHQYKSNFLSKSIFADIFFNVIVKYYQKILKNV